MKPVTGNFTGYRLTDNRFTTLISWQSVSLSASVSSDFMALYKSCIIIIIIIIITESLKKWSFSPLGMT